MPFERDQSTRTTIDDGRREEATRTLAEVFEVNPIVARFRIAGLWGSDGLPPAL